MRRGLKVLAERGDLLAQVFLNFDRPLYADIVLEGMPSLQISVGMPNQLNREHRDATRAEAGRNVFRDIVNLGTLRSGERLDGFLVTGESADRLSHRLGADGFELAEKPKFDKNVSAPRLGS